MQRYSFATLTTVADGKPVANHLPFVVEQVNNKIILTSHLAKANEQGGHLTGQPLLVIFTEPHAYISTRHYEKELNVPTWNYIAVHAYGTGSLIESDAGKLAVLEKMIRVYETEYLEKWQGMPDEFKLKMLKGITAFSIEVTDLQGKSKLSQNRTPQERENIISELSKSESDAENQLAAYMKP